MNKCRQQHDSRRHIATAIAASTAVALLVWAGRPALPAPGRPLLAWLASAPPDRVVTAVAAEVAWLLALYLLGLFALAAVAELAGRRGAWLRRFVLRLAPGVLGVVLRAGLGATVIGGAVLPVALPAAAAPAGAAPATAAQAAAAQAAGAGAHLPAGTAARAPGTGTAAGARGTGAAAGTHLDLPSLDRPGARAPAAAPTPGHRPPAAAPAPPATAGRPSARPVVVRPGDTLWSLAARALGPGATSADIDAGWRAWHAANRGVIGSDPGLLHPGQRLRPPARSADHPDTVPTANPTSEESAP